MNYLGETIKKLGFGFMRLPVIGNEVDIVQTKEMVDVFMSQGLAILIRHGRTWTENRKRR